MAADHEPAIRYRTLFQALIAQGCSVEVATRVANADPGFTLSKSTPVAPVSALKSHASHFAWR